MTRTLEQQRAAYAWAFVNELIQPGVGDEVREKISTHINKTPIRILQNGLGQAMAFLLQDAGNDPGEPAGKLYVHLQDWLCGSTEETKPCRIYPTGGNLMHQLITQDQREYHIAAEEALQLFTWLKKFAKAYLE